MFRDDFPSCNIIKNNQNIVYLDSAATTFKPQCVLDAMNDFYINSNANPHSNVYELSYQAGVLRDKARENVKNFINANSTKEIVFTSGATASLNLIAYSYGLNFLSAEDKILIYIAEHHSNFVPWQALEEKLNLKLKFINTTKDGCFDFEDYKNKLSNKTKLVCVAHVSNVLGVEVPVKEIAKLAHENNALVVLDAAQSIAHLEVDVAKLDVDFLAFSAHKMYGPMGIGVLWAKEELLDKMPPFLFGGDMINKVTTKGTTFKSSPTKFEAGTQHISGEVGLSVAIDYINSIGYEYIKTHEEKLMKKLILGLKEFEDIEIYGPLDYSIKTGVVAFNYKNVHPHDLASILDNDALAIRAGHHCANPLMEALNIFSCARVSLGIYNNEEDIDKFLASLAKVKGVFF